MGIVSFTKFTPNPKLCVIRTLKAYLNRSGSIRRNEQTLFISFRKNHEKVGDRTLARCVRTGMAMAGVNISVFKAHSIWGASTSKLATLHLPIASIMAKASWKSESTFKKYYQKQVVNEKDIAHDMLRDFVLNTIK